MDDINTTFERCGIESTNFKGLPINIRPNDHSLFAVRQHIWWLRDQFIGEIKEEILASPDCAHSDKKNAWRLVSDHVSKKLE